MEVRFDINGIDDAMRAERMIAVIVDALRDDKSATATVYDEIWSYLQEKTGGTFLSPGEDETDQQYFARLVSGISDCPCDPEMSPEAEAWHSAAAEVPKGQDIVAPPGFYEGEPATAVAEPSPPPQPSSPRDKLAAYNHAKSERDATKSEPVAEPQKVKKTRKPRATATEAPVVESEPEPPGPSRATATDIDVTEARNQVVALARTKGIEWARLVLSLYSVSKFSELSDADAVAILRDHEKKISEAA